MKWGIPFPGRLRLAFLLWAAFLACTPFVQAQRLIPFQGRLTDANGKPVPDGVRLIQFRIFDAATGGNSVWPPGELHRTTVNAGLINVVLGSKTLFTGVDFNRTLYLDIVVDGNGDNQITADDPPLLPRQAILPVIFATESADSRKLAGYDWTAIFGTNNPSGKIEGAKIANITSNQIAPQTINSSLVAQQVLEALNPAGVIAASMRTETPDGWLLCDGSVVSRTQYARLFSAIGISAGPGDGSTTFNLPDLRGMFLRGFTGTRSDSFRDPDADSRTNTVAGGNNGNNLGSVQTYALQGHSHKLRKPAILASGASARNVNINVTGIDTVDYSSATAELYGYLAVDIMENGSNGVPKTSNETRPQNVFVNYIIKF